MLELLQGGELSCSLIYAIEARQSKLTEQWARFYAATVVHAFSSLHAKRIAYTV